MNQAIQELFGVKCLLVYSVCNAARLDLSDTEAIKAAKPAIDYWLGTQGRMEEARNLFRNKETTEFVIVTIPTAMAAAESGRLAKALLKEGVPVKSLAINQVSSPAVCCHPLSAV